MSELFILPDKLFSHRLKMSKKLSKIWNDLKDDISEYNDINKYINDNPGICLYGTPKLDKEYIAAKIYFIIAGKLIMNDKAEEYTGESHYCPFVTGYNFVDNIEKDYKVNIEEGEYKAEIPSLKYFSKARILFISRLCELPNYYGRDWKLINNVLYTRLINSNFTMITTDHTIDEIESSLEKNWASENTMEILKKYKLIDVS